MGSFGNYVGASFGDAYESAWVVGNYQDPKNESLLDANGKLIQLPPSALPKDSGRYQPYKPTSDQLGRAASSDHNAWEEIERDLHAPGSNAQGAHSLNWEGQSFVAMQKESNQLNPQELTRLAKLWRDGGNTLKTQSENFRNSVRDHISGKWSGSSADAADTATQQLTKTSIFDFTRASDALANRLDALSTAFTHIKANFPTIDPGQLIESGNFNQQQLSQEINDFNTKYHLDGDGRLRDRSNRYIAAADAIQEMQRLQRSTSDYQAAVQLFRDTYNPTVEAVTADFPNLPAAPNMTFGQPPPPSGPSGPGGGGGAPFGGGGGGPGPISAPNIPGNPNMPRIPTDPNAGPASPFANLQNAGQFGELAQQGLTAASQAASQASQAMNQALGAAQRAGATPALGGASNPHSMPPEGVLGLGAAGGKGALGKVGGAGGGVGAPSPSIAKPANAPATAAGRTTDRTVAAGSRAGLGGAAGSTGAGMPGAGAPAAGQHGAGAPGGPYQPNKALRSKQNGKELIGEAEAVPAVLGEPAPPHAPKPRPDARKTTAT